MLYTHTHTRIICIYIYIYAYTIISPTFQHGLDLVIPGLIHHSRAVDEEDALHEGYILPHLGLTCVSIYRYRVGCILCMYGAYMYV